MYKREIVTRKHVEIKLLCLIHLTLNDLHHVNLFLEKYTINGFDVLHDTQALFNYFVG